MSGPTRMIADGEFTPSTDEEILARLTADWVLEHLEPWEQELVVLWTVEELSFAEIGAIIGPKYRDKVLTGSTIRYHKDRIRRRLKELAYAAGHD